MDVTRGEGDSVGRDTLLLFELANLPDRSNGSLEPPFLHEFSSSIGPHYLLSILTMLP